MRASIQASIRTFTRATGLALAASLCVASAAFAAGHAAGMVLEVTGTTAPVVDAFSELTERTTVSLEPGSKLTFIHYGTCRQVTVSGGKLYIDRGRYSLAGGKVESEEKTNCPGEQKLAADATGGNATGAAAIVMRNLPPTPTLSGHPEIVLAGAHGGEVTTAVLQRGGKALGSMTTAGRKVFWPADKPALTAGDDYSVHLATADGKRAVEFKFAVAGDAGKAPVILRVD